MNISLNNLKISNLLKDNIWILCVIFVAIITGVAIVNAKWLYTGILLIPLLIYLCINKPFIFPFGLYVLLLPFDSILSVTGSNKGATLTKFLGILTMAVLLFKGVFENKIKWPDKTSYWWIFFMAYASLSLLWVTDIGSALSILPTAAGLFIFYLVSASYETKKSEFNTLKWFILIGGFISVIYEIYQYMKGSYGMEGRMTLEVGERSTDPNMFAFSLIIPISVCIQTLIEQKVNIIKGLLVVVFGVMLFGLIITGSRGGFLGIVVMFYIYILSFKHKVKLGTILIVIGIILSSFIPDFFVERWADTGGAGRTTIWYIGLKALEKYWFFGAGLNNFPNAFNEFAHYATYFNKFDRGAHNIYLEILVSYGIIGFFLLVASLTKHYRAAMSRFTQYKLDSIMLKASFWAILISSFFLGTFWSKSFWLLWMLIIMYKNVVDKEMTDHKKN